MEKAKVYFTRTITPEKVVEMYKALGKELPGKIACKVHTGEAGNRNYLHPEFWKPMVDYVNGTVVECNAAYQASRHTTEAHQKLIKEHGWDIFDFDLLDAEGPDMELPVRNGKQLKVNYVGKNQAKYDSMLVLAHFKGHDMAGMGGALKQLSIGCGSSAGKSWIHSAGKTTDQYELWNNLPENDFFLEAMADAAGSVVDSFKGNMAFINVLKNLSTNCDCVPDAPLPCMSDIGILASVDPVAIDQASYDLVAASTDPGKKELLDTINGLNGLHTVDCAAEQGYGTKEYELIDLDK